LSYYVVHEFFVASVLKQLVALLLQHPGRLAPVAADGHASYMWREPGAVRDRVSSLILDAIPDVAPRVGLGTFTPAAIEMTLKSVRHGALAAAPPLDALDERSLGFVYFLHREPRRFEGGALRLRFGSDECLIEPALNSMVFFRGGTTASVDAVHASTDQLIDSRLTLEGWVRTAQ
jgi:hypothetical protein